MKDSQSDIEMILNKLSYKKAPMKYELSFCEIEQLSENIFEIIAREGTVVDKKCADESWNFWNDLRDQPFGLLVNCKNKYSRSFEGSRELGKHPLQYKTAIYCESHGSNTQLKTTLQIKQITGHFWNHKVFSDKQEAVNWLSDV